MRQVDWGVDFAEETDFRARVEADIRGQIDPSLRSPENARAWYDELIAIRQDVETQLSRRKAEIEAFKLECQEKNGALWHGEYSAERARYERWRATAVAFLRRVNQRIAEAKRVLDLDRAKVNQAFEALRAENDRLREENLRLSRRLSEIEAYLRGVKAGLVDA